MYVCYCPNNMNKLTRSFDIVFIFLYTYKYTYTDFSYTFVYSSDDMSNFQ